MKRAFTRTLPAVLPALALLAAPGVTHQEASAQVAVAVPRGEPTGWIGVSVEMRGMMETGSGDTDTRVFITDVRPDGPAARAGLRPGDILLSLNGRSPEDGFADMLRALAPGDPVTVAVRRDGVPRRFRFTAGTRPLSGEGASTFAVLARADTLADRMYRAMDSLRLRIATGEVDGTPPRVGGVVRLQAVEGGELPSPAPVPGTGLIRVLERTGPGGAVVRDTALTLEVERRPFHLLFLREDSAAPAVARVPEAEDPRRWQVRTGDGEEATYTFRPLAPYALGQNRAGGAEVVELKPELAAYFGVERGVLVVDVASGTPAAQAGLLPGDVLVALGGVVVGSVAELRKGLAQPRDSLVVRYIRKGESREGILRR